MDAVSTTTSSKAGPGTPEAVFLLPAYIYFPDLFHLVKSLRFHKQPQISDSNIHSSTTLDR
jgi:hypothetical protein